MSADISHLLIEAVEKGEGDTGDGIFFLLPDNYARPNVSDDDQMAHMYLGPTHGEWACLVEWPSHGEGPWI